MADVKKENKSSKGSDSQKNKTNTGNKENIKAAYKPDTRQRKPRAAKAVYTPNSVNLDSKFETGAAYDELYAYQALQSKFDGSLMDYKVWAKENIHYSGLTKPQMQQKLRQCNDSYTIAAISDMLSSFREGIDVSTLVQFYVTTGMMKAMNPSFDMDVSRLVTNLRSNLMDKIGADPGKADGAFGGLYQELGKSAVNMSAAKMNSEIKRNLSQHTVDTMIMTPRQVAALKLNFTEQCYVDMRKVGSSEEIDEIYEKYKKAVGHLDAIAENSGFSMSVVAAEERYLAGLKINENPAYANVFKETFDFGVYMKHDTTGFWSGEFLTRDGSSYTTGGKDSESGLDMGAFLPRPPYQSTVQGDSTAALKNSLERRAKLFAEAEKYLESKADCEFGSDPRKLNEIKNQFRMQIDRYKDNMASMLQDDGIVSSSRAGNKFIEEYFDNVYEKEKNSKAANAMSEAVTREIKHSANRDILTAANVDTSYFSGKNKCVSPEETEKQLKSIRDQMKEYADNEKFKAAKNSYERSGDKRFKEFFVDENGNKRPDSEVREHFRDIRGGREIIDDMRRNTMQDLDSYTCSDLLMRAVYNVEQGYMDRGAFERPNSLDNETIFQSEVHTRTSSAQREVPEFGEPEESPETNYQPM